MHACCVCPEKATSTPRLALGNGSGFNNHRRAWPTLGDDPLPPAEHCVTSEEVPIGGMPGWLKEQIRLQSLGIPSDDPSFLGRILIIYPTENSRRQALSSIGLHGGVDRTLHHTMESLLSSLIADLRLPRVIPNEGPLTSILHSECKKEAARLGFPLINPLPEMKWGKGKTEALVKLHRHLSRDLVANRWDGPGITTFRRIIHRMEKKLRFTHPDMVCERIIDSLEGGRVPFTISDIDGIIMLDHSPVMCRSFSETLLSLSKLRPIHQLTYPGNFRLGHHGFMLVDEHPIKDPKDLPKWVPSGRIPQEESSVQVNRIMLRREQHSFQTAVSIVANRLGRGDAEVIIVDPALEKNRHRWEQLLGEIGISLERRKKPPSSHPIGHWILCLARLGHGAEAFSLDNLRALSLQSSIVPFEKPKQHPSGKEFSPIADSELLTRLARNEHVLGGPGALFKWIETLSRAPRDEKDGVKKESTQWWILCLAKSLWPLLRESDRQQISKLGNPIGCHSGQPLPLPMAATEGDVWLIHTLSLIDMESQMKRFSGRGLSPASAVKALIDERLILRKMQRISGQVIPTLGSEWVDELTSLAQKTRAMTGGPNFSGSVSVMRPEEALGCTADLFVMANLSSSSWDLRVPKAPFLSEDERHSLGILRPDGPIRDARHCFQHILSSSPEVFVLDPSLDETAPPAAPIREWAQEFELTERKGHNEQNSMHPSPRHSRQIDGSLIRKGRSPIHPPLNPSSVSIPLDKVVQRDRERRQPSIAGTDGYLGEKNSPHLLSLDKLKFHAKTPEGVESPRTNNRWPVVGGTYNGKTTPSIDPRPLSPLATGAQVSDSRHGHSGESPQKIPVWSPTRLQSWLQCPRKGWLSKELGADRQELQDENIDSRTFGELLHNVHHDIIAQVLGFETSEERFLDGGSGQISVQRSGLDKDEVMQIALESLDSRAPWLERTDAVSIQRLRSLTGMTKEEWSSWLADPKPTPPKGRIGGIVTAELEVGDSAPLSIEWRIGIEDSEGMLIGLQPEITGKEGYEPIKIRGSIDRVDILPIDSDSDTWIDHEGDDSVAPLRVHGSGWKPRRIVAIRDLKTSESDSPKNRHYKGLLEELQLAIYSRAWEEAHPGDLVLAAGISVFGHKPEHFLETSSLYHSSKGNKIGTRTSITRDLHRFQDEDENPTSDHFRAWLAQRLSVALRVANNARLGKVHPTPSRAVCTYCPVSEICNVRMEGSF